MEPDKYSRIYESIQNLDPKIRFITIVDYEGKLLSGGQREGISNHLKPEYQMESLVHAMDSWKLRDKFFDFIGKGKYAVAEYEKIKRITIPFEDKKIIYLTTEIDVDHNKLIEKIQNIIQWFYSEISKKS